jgi:histidinol phosphatase-like PHP family hydrolase
MAHKRQPIIVIGRQNPAEHSYNSWEHKIRILQKFDISVFSLHRKSIGILDAKYKQSLLEFYKSIYNDDIILREIRQLLHPTVPTI